MKNSNGILTHKRWICVALLMSLLLAAAVPAFADTYGTVRTSSGNNANLREWASYDAGIITSLPNGSMVEIVREDGDWYAVWTNGMAGYIHKSLVYVGRDVTPGNPGNNNQTPDCNTASVVAGPLNLRETPSLNGRVITQLTSGATVTVLSYGSTWTQVRVGNVCGYLMTSYLNFGSNSNVSKPSTTTANANATIRTSNGGNLNLRADASYSAYVLGSYANGTRVRVLTHGSSWCKVQVGNQVGYMVSKFLAFDGMSGNTGSSSSGKTYEAVVSSNQALNLRSQPSTSSKSLGHFYNGTAVTVLGVGTEWLRVRVNGVEGYMMAKYVKIISSKATAHKTVSNNGSYVNLRSGAGYGYSVLKRVSDGAAATVVIPYSVWSKVIVKDGSGYLTGYMLNSFLK